jgi:hypothetical protein
MAGANGSRECAPDDKLRDTHQLHLMEMTGFAGSTHRTAATFNILKIAASRSRLFNILALVVADELPLPRWVVKTRKAVLWVGLGWPVAVLLLSDFTAKCATVTWTFIGIAFLATIFGSVAVVLSLILPSYKSRIIVVPPLLIVVFWIVSSGSLVPPYMLLWITTFTAIGLLIPQHSTLEYFFRRLFARRA